MSTSTARGRPSRVVNVVLTGFMGTGKTTVGRIVADRLDRAFVDTDTIIEERHGPIAEIFASRGEAAFREMERAVADALRTQSNMVIATGGRLMLDPEARASLQERGRVFCLVADVDELVARLTEAAEERPLLSGDDPAARIRALLEQRAAAYAEFEQVATSGRSPEAIADDILARLDD